MSYATVRLFLPDESGRSPIRWLPALGLVAVLHFGVWWAFTHFKTEAPLPRPLPTVEVTLIAPIPPQVQPEPPQPEPPRPKSEPKPRPLTQTVPAPIAKQVQETPVEQSAPAAVAAAPTPVVSTPAPTTVPPSPAPVPEPVVEPPRFNAAYLSNPKPAYPLAARRRGIEGKVLLRVEVAASGEALHVEIKKGSGHEMLDQAALEAVRKWHFVPAKRGNTAVAAWVEVPLVFKLDE